MITDKILIFSPFAVDINAGGPQGFLAHNLLDKPRERFIFLQDIIKNSSLSQSLKDSFFYRIVSHRLKKYPNIDQTINQHLYWANNCNKYKYIFFHDCYTFKTVAPFISSKQTVIIQSHSPELPSEEQIANGAPKYMIEFIREAEMEAFKRADVIVFPNVDILPLYEKVLVSQNNIRYLLSGCKPPSELRTFPLDREKVNFLYLGRRTNVKGFDIVLKAFRKAYIKRKDIQLIIGGKGPEITEPGVCDIGFTTSSTNWFASVDHVFNANRKSYFDLSVMETLSVGTPITMTTNFGHRYFKDKGPGIIDFNSLDELIYIMINSQKTIESKTLRNLNRSLFEHELTDKQYYQRFLAFANEL